LNNTFLNDQWVTEENRVEIKKFPEPREMKTQLTRLYGKCSYKMEVYKYECLHYKNQRNLKMNKPNSKLVGGVK
jgi:hypothetical protein